MKKCPEVSLQEIAPCEDNLPSCEHHDAEKECKVGAWGAWSSCSVTCGMLRKSKYLDHLDVCRSGKNYKTTKTWKHNPLEIEIHFEKEMSMNIY